KAAKRAIKAGFDFITIHSGHGLLFQNFMSPLLNNRTDEYGGSTEKRNRLLIETIEEIRSNIGEKPPIFVRFSADELINDGYDIEEGKLIAKVLEKGGVDCLDITQGVYFRTPIGIDIPTYYDHGCYIGFAEAIKKVVKIPVIGVGRIVDPKMADEFIQQGKADIINMGRQLICDADTPNKYFNGQYDDIRYCIGCLQSCLGACVQDAFSGQNYQELIRSTEPKKIIVLGAGISGMEAARILKLRGHEVDIYEKSNQVGGVMNLVAAEYKKGEYIKISNFLESQLKKLNVPIYLKKELTKEDLTKLNPDILVLATGSEAAVPVNLKGKSNVLTQDESILKSKPFGKDLVIWGLNVYWKGGVETAVSLIEEGYNVKALIGSNKYENNWGWNLAGRRFWLRRYLKEKEIPIYDKAKLLDVTENGVRFLSGKNEELFIESDALIYCGSRIANGKVLKAEFEGIIPDIILIGDCKQPRDIGAAMKDAQEFARSLK
ncbi:MAG: oxidoreductase, partial [Promethearchaeota archaeon]